MRQSLLGGSVFDGGGDERGRRNRDNGNTGMASGEDFSEDFSEDLI
jgi:hypothetical protein